MVFGKLESFSRRTLIFIFIGALLLALLATALVEYTYATKYSINVNVIKSTQKIGINPLTTSLDYGDTSPGGKSKRFITLKNEGNRSSYIIIWKSGVASDLVSISDNFFTLKSGKEKTIDFLLKVPASASYKKYAGKIYIFRLPKIF